MDHNKFTQYVPMKDVIIKDRFWKGLMETTRAKMLPYQWKALNDLLPDTEPSHCMRNYRIAAGLEEGEYGGKVFQDSDVAKWIEAAAFSLVGHPDEELEQRMDETIDLIVNSQQPDGYIGTYYTITGMEKRWTNVMRHHELYCAGHLIEAAVAYYNASGKDKLLKAVIRYAGYIDTVFGPEEGKLHAYPGHEVIEMALVKLYRVTKDEKHLRIARYFIDERGKQPNYFAEEIKKYGNEYPWKDSYFQFDYFQSGSPVRETQSAVGHAVRAVYLYSGMADVARETLDESLYKACRRMWESIVKKKMYITGSIGSSAYGETFTFDYDLPNDTVYGETCAAVGLVFFAHRMLQMDARGEYGDIMEKVLYNGAISGMSLDGTKFFYVNPLEVFPEAAEKDQHKRHVKVQRQKWFACACCPPNLARLIESIAAYIYTARDNQIFINLYVGNTSTVHVGDKVLVLSMETNYPWDGDVNITVNAEKPCQAEIALRIPGWCEDYSLYVDNEPIEDYRLEDQYLYIRKVWSRITAIRFNMGMPVRMMAANAGIRDDVGKAAVMRGPLVYCLEEADNGKDLHKVVIPKDIVFDNKFEENFLGGIVTIASNGLKQADSEQDGSELYYPYASPVYKKVSLKWIPYYAWANRDAGEMIVWVRKD